VWTFAARSYERVDFGGDVRVWLPKTQSGEDNKHRVNRRTSFQGYREVDLGVIQGAFSVRRA